MRKHHIIYPLSLISYLLSPSPIHAVWEQVQYGDVATFGSLSSLFTNILSITLRLVGISMFIMIVVGGFKYLTAGGDSKATEAAQGTITNAIIGLVLAIMAWFILLAIKGFTGVDVTKFNIITQ